MDSGSSVPLFSGKFFAFEGKRYSFLKALRVLEEDVMVATDDDLLDWFSYYWTMKAHFWNIGALKYERNVSSMLNVCWRELDKRGYIMLDVDLDGDSVAFSLR